MAHYMDSFDSKEFELFRAFNNHAERGTRHVDTYIIEDYEKDFQKVERNIKKMIEETVKQLKMHPEFFEEVTDADEARTP